MLRTIQVVKSFGMCCKVRQWQVDLHCSFVTLICLSMSGICSFSVARFTNGPPGRDSMGGVLIRHRPRGGDLEVGGGDYQLPLHRRHHLPRLTPWIPGGLRYGDRHP